MYQKYSIGTMAKLMGISAEAIRYYESRNIISPVRDRKQVTDIIIHGIFICF